MTFRSRLIAGVSTALVTMIFIGALTFRTVARSREDIGWVTHTHLVLEALDAVSANMTDAETGQRGFLLTGQEPYLEPYNDALNHVQESITVLRALTSDNPAQQRNLDRLEPVVALKLAELQFRLEIRKRDGLNAAAEAVREGSGRLHMNQIRAVIADMKHEERRLLVARTQEAIASSSRAGMVIVIGNLLALLFLSLAGMVIFQEMGQRRRAEEEVRSLNVDLEQRVANRTAELAERAKDLARSNGELQQFAYVASHDLQEPLRMVASFTQLLAKRYSDKLDDDAREFINYAVDGAKRMQTLISDLLSYSRVGTQGKAFELVHCDAVLDRVLKSLQLAIEDTGAVITREPLPAVAGDSIQLTQLFQNLLTNAIKFHGKKPPLVQISTENNGSMWKIAVRDNGIGISPEHADRIFVIFQRLHTKTEYPGTGIGLAICKKIVERHGGRIWVEASPGGGSTFFFTIPVAHNKQNQEVQERQQDDVRIAV
jgi:signal transduction histidine kinase